MRVEWEQHMQRWSMLKGVAAFEQWVVERGGEQTPPISVEWEVMQRLYADPCDLSVLENNPRARLLAQALIQHAMLDKQLEVYQRVSDTAKDLANVVESGQRTGANTIMAGLRALLPWPFK
jgi:hypothetical protein